LFDVSLYRIISLPVVRKPWNTVSEAGQQPTISGKAEPLPAAQAAVTKNLDTIAPGKNLAFSNKKI
ncbi:MAG TPA: hypothetical protein PKH19_01815, partial [Candidatus Syntrophosphaera sp.]|nr:hypothetical protein [Candidatus Syntrophosphaera sp.]